MGMSLHYLLASHISRVNVDIVENVVIKQLIVMKKSKYREQESLTKQI